jgi:formylglycine-generating enzyme required for sulfatase activity
LTIARPFRCGVVPVTHAQFAVFDPEHSVEPWEGVARAELAYHPVVGITWYEAVSFCRWLSSVFPWARGARLPVEEEWEYACRAGTESRYWSGDSEDDLARVGWYVVNSGNRTHRVGEKPANPWGLYDVHGNVWEWTLSPWTESYEVREKDLTCDLSTVEVDPAPSEAPGGDWRVLRGGSFWYVAVDARAAFRDHRNPRIVNELQGFRVVLPSGPEFLDG